MKRSTSPKKGVKKSPAPKLKAKPKTVKKAVAAVKAAAKKVVKKISSVTKSKAKPAVKPIKKAVKKVAAKKIKKAVAAPAAKKASGSGLVKKVVKGFKAALKKVTPKARPEAAAKTAPAKAKAKASSKVLRPKAFPARDAQKSFGFPDGVPELPESYGEDTLVLMTQDPEYLFTYWEITPEQHALSEKAKHDGQEYQEALRLNWTARDLFAPNFALLPVSLKARRGYLRVPYSGLSYQVEIGWVSDQGHFISILGRSNRSDAPESWKQTRARLKKTAGERSVLEYNLDITQPLGSSELGRRQGTLTEGKVFPSDWNFEGPGSLSSSASSGAVVKKIPAAQISGNRTATPAKKSPKRRG